MANIRIKQKEENRTPIKIFDRKENYKKKLKDSIINIKNKTNIQTNEIENNNQNEYGANKITEKANIIFHRGTTSFNKYGQKSLKNTTKNIQSATQKIKQKIQNKNIKTADKFLKSSLKNTNRTLRGIKQTRNFGYKATKNTAKIMKKSAMKSYRVTKETAKKTVNGLKVAVKATISTVKAIMLASKALISAIIAGGWVAIFIIIIVCLIGLICSSVFGIFFSSEKEVKGKTMSSVVSEINTEFTNKITDIQNNTEHDDYEINSNRAEWKDVISIYAVEISNGEEQTDVITLDDKKVKKLKEIFWKMNMISSRVEEIEKDIEITDENGNTKTEKQKRKVLYIDVTSKTIEEMAKEYNFNKKQKEQLVELRKEEYASVWNNVIYGSSVGSQDIVQVALAQVGNVGGQPYWSWYGFTSRVEWCACFVSWCAEQCGYIETGIIPKFASVNVEGVPWFKTVGLWKDGGYSPKRRRYNIF